MVWGLAHRKLVTVASFRTTSLLSSYAEFPWWAYIGKLTARTPARDKNATSLAFIRCSYSYLGLTPAPCHGLPSSGRFDALGRQPLICRPNCLNTFGRRRFSLATVQKCNLSGVKPRSTFCPTIRI